MKIRKATKKDILGMGELMIKEFNKPPYKQGWKQNTVKKTLLHYFKVGFALVVVENKKIIGALIAMKEPYAKGLNIIVEELLVDSKYQGKGLGKSLLIRIEQIAKKQKAHTIYLSSNRKSKAYNFYKKLGYKESKNLAIMGKKIK